MNQCLLRMVVVYPRGVSLWSRVAALCGLPAETLTSNVEPNNKINE